MTTTPTDATEHRLALVMNGGVSLAVWMGGVAQEIDTLRRATNGFPTPAAERELFAKWAEVAAAAKMTFTVDVIAGTSAGGLNGVLLATAIGRGVPLAGLRTLWMKAPALTRKALLRRRKGDPTSILDGTFFQEQIALALSTLGEAAAAAAQAGEARPADVSLTVTATGLGGEARRMADRNGSPFRAQDHRRRYGFQRAGRRVCYRGVPGTFPPDPVDHLREDAALALAGRATASFPTAFAPVKESAALRDRRVWPTWDTGDATEYLADGGLLDNSPFDTVLDAIAAQPVEASWHRTLCFVVPSADEAGFALATDESVPPPWTTVVGAALGDPREADLREDVERMHDLVRAGRTSYDVERLQLLLDAPPDPDLGGRSPFEIARTLATEGFVLYRDARRAAAVYDALDVANRAIPEAYLQPQVQVTAKDVGREDHQWVADAFPTDLPEHWTWGILAAQRLVTLLVRSVAGDKGAPYDALRSRLSETGLQLTAVRAAIGDAIRHEVGDDTTVPPPAEMVQILDRVFKRLDVPTVAAQLVSGAVEAYATTTGRDRVRVLQAALCVEVANGVGGAPVDLQTRPRFDFLRLGIGTPPPMFAAAFTPAGGTVAPASNILYGSRLTHFAAFGREEWRRWDWLWGRLHAAVQLVSLMGFDDDTRDGHVDELVGLILAAEGTTEEQVRAGIAHVLSRTQRDLLKDMARDGSVRRALDAVLALVASDATTQPPIYVGIRRLGKLLRPGGRIVARLVELRLRL